MFCIPILYSIMDLFCIDMGGPTFFAAAWCVLVGYSPPQEAWVMSVPRLMLGWAWVGSGEQWNAASNLPAEPVAAFHGLKHILFKTESRVGQEKGKRSAPKTDTDFTQKPDKGQIHWLFRVRPGGFTQIKSFGHNDETTQGAYLSLTQLQYKTVGKRQKKL